MNPARSKFTSDESRLARFVPNGGMPRISSSTVTARNSGWTKLDKYYSKISDSPAYTAGAVLNPSNKRLEIENSWCREWIPSAKIMVQQFWESEYKPKLGIISDSRPNLISVSTCSTDMAESTYKTCYDDRKRAQALAGISVEGMPKFLQHSSRYAVNSSCVGRSVQGICRKGLSIS